MVTSPIDRTGRTVKVGSKVRLLRLSGKWFDELPADEKEDVSSMIGDVFFIEEVDDYGHAWIRKSWPDEEGGRCHSHSIALEPDEMELVEE